MNCQNALQSDSNIGHIMFKKNCTLCFGEFEGSSPSYCPKLRKMCYNYLHPALTQENLRIPSNDEMLSLCPRCLESATKLVEFSDKLKFYQKSISDLILIFSLEILHRRGKIADINDFFQNAVSGNEQAKTNVFLSPNRKAWSSPEISENISTDETEFSVLIPISTDNGTNYVSSEVIKCENNQFHWTNENVEDENDNNTKLSIAQDMESSFTVLGSNKKQFPMLNHQRKRLQFSTTDFQFRSDAYKNGEIRNTNQTQHNSEKKYKTVDNKRSQDEKCSETLESIESFSTSRIVNSTNLLSSTASEIEPFQQLRRAGETLFYCSLCPKSFLQSNDLLIHLQNDHKKQKPFKCQTCGKEFVFKCHLKVHTRTHTKEKPFKCPTCSKRFIQNHDLVRHIRTHTGEKPFQCDQCDYAAVQYHALKAHKRRHSDLKTFKCKECEKQFKTVDDLKSHYKRIHFALDFSNDCIIKNI